MKLKFYVSVFPWSTAEGPHAPTPMSNFPAWPRCEGERRYAIAFEVPFEVPEPSVDGTVVAAVEPV